MKVTLIKSNKPTESLLAESFGAVVICESFVVGLYITVVCLYITEEAEPSEWFIWMTGRFSPLNRNSPRLGMGFWALNTPSMVWVIRKMSTDGCVARSSLLNCCPLSVPESYGGNMVTFQVSRHCPLSQRSWLSIPTNQSGDGASMLIRDTLEKLEVTWTWILGSSPTAPSPDPGRMSCQAFPSEIWDSISLRRVPVWPRKNRGDLKFGWFCCCEPSKYWNNL